ncbi:hypothetical protein [Kitasatospora sp. LaBMicrA B282]|uniref:hypothetical protein n=1 Tax=Kitasatospora sp. LaBMicrA B282 TaxID=3420949 RepID=UPI003D0FE30C
MDAKKTAAELALEDQIRAAGADAADAETARRGAARRIPVRQAPQWYRTASATMQAALATGRLTHCEHLAGGPQPVVLLAERPEHWYCRPCAQLGRATRRCLHCGRPAGGLTPKGGHEEVVQGPVVTYSMVRCPDCFAQDTEVPSTFRQD